jgi:hypothetical protein
MREMVNRHMATKAQGLSLRLAVTVLQIYKALLSPFT